MIFSPETEHSLLADLGQAAPAEEQASLSKPLNDTFVIDSEDRANWYLRKLANIAGERERIKANSAAMLADLKREEDSLKGHFEPQLREWVQGELLRRKSKKKSLPLFQGVISFKTVPASFSISDPEAAFTYARTFLPEMIETKLVLNAGAYAAASKESRLTERLDETTGELVPGNLFPGTEVKPEYESMSIKFVAPKGAIEADETEARDA